MKRKITEAEIEAILNKNKLINSENELKRIPMTREYDFLEKIRLGKYQEITFIDYRELEASMGRSTRDHKRQFEYTTVSGITLATRAAIDGGLRPDDAYDISETMLQMLEQARTIEEMHDIMELTGVVFAHQVQKSKKEISSYLIERCKIYISRNVFLKIYLEDIAEYVGVNPSYLSRIFSLKEGITIQEYIQKKKIDLACNLLKFSDRTIAEIAQYIGFQSQSNFSALFKKWKMVSPTEYRDTNKQINFTSN